MCSHGFAPVRVFGVASLFILLYTLLVYASPDRPCRIRWSNAPRQDIEARIRAMPGNNLCLLAKSSGAVEGCNKHQMVDVGSFLLRGYLQQQEGSTVTLVTVHVRSESSLSDHSGVPNRRVTRNHQIEDRSGCYEIQMFLGLRLFSASRCVGRSTARRPRPTNDSCGHDFSSWRGELTWMVPVDGSLSRSTLDVS